MATNAQTNSTTANSTVPPQQEQFEQDANLYNKVYNKEQQEVSKLQNEVSNMSSWGQMLMFLGTLSCMTQWMSTVQVCADNCAEALDGLLQGAESIFSNGVQFIDNESQEMFKADKSGDSGVPIPSVSTLNSTYETQVQNADLFVTYLQDIDQDVNGAYFTDVGPDGKVNNPLSGIATSVNNADQDFMFQMVSTYNEMYNNVSNGKYTPSSSSPPGSPGSYSSNGDGNNYLNDPTAYIDNSNPSNPMSGANSGDIVCYAMLNYFYQYATPVNYSFESGGPSNNPGIYSPTITQNPSSYAITTDFQSINAYTTGFAPQTMPELGMVTNITGNALSVLKIGLGTINSFESNSVSHQVG